VKADLVKPTVFRDIKLPRSSMLLWGRALLQKRHSSSWVMTHAMNFDWRDLMKRVSWLMQASRYYMT